jgi:tetratricopeptide (TPR) repeat protein
MVTKRHRHKILFCTQNPVSYMDPPRLNEEQVLCGPFVKDQILNGKVLGLSVPPGEYDIQDVLTRIPEQQRPDLIVVKADAARNNFPRNLGTCNIPSVLILGDTTHMKAPLQVMLRYAASESYSLYVTDHKRHHLHWFQNLGLGPVAWTPGLFVKDFEIPFETLRDVPLSFVGQAGKFHPWRAFMLAEMEKRGIKVSKGRAPQKDAAAIYARSQATLNFSLNADLNLRVFEVLAAGGCLVTDRLSPQAGQDVLFISGQEFFGYDGLEDLVSLLDILNKNPRLCLEVAAAGQKKFQERHSPDIKRRDFLETVMAGEGRGTFDLPLDLRGKVCGMRDENSFFARVEQYEWFQERHRCGESLKIRFAPGAEMSLACDLVDLPRHKVYCEDNSLPIFAIAGVVGQIHLANSLTDFDVLVVGASDEIPQVGAPILISDFSVLPENEKQSVLSRMRNSGFEKREDLSGYFVKSKPIAIDVSSFRPPNLANIESARSAFSGGLFSDAEGICREILGKDERSAGAWHIMGRIAALKGDLEAAGEFESVACDLDPHNSEFLRELAEVFLRKKELEPAERQVRRALEMAPDSPEGLVLLGRILAEKDDKHAALKAFQDALRLRNDYAEGFSQYATALQKFGCGKDAISRIRKACSLAPDSVEFQTILAMLLEQNARWEDALAAYGKAARMNPDVSFVWFRQGKLLNGLGRYAEAIPILEKAISRPGVLGEYFYEMGLAFDMSKRFPEALEYYKKALAAGYDTAKSDASIAPRVVP